MSATHSVAYPPSIGADPAVDALDLSASSVPARKYPFELDEFQRLATACVERHESVLVAAHTSAGKTVVAEHAIAAALRDGGRCIYSSPIKALSNQKHRELEAAFGDVGLLTGDATLNEDASCLVMTTEILRLMLYRGSSVVREVRWIVFDEAHMLGSADRGWVIEETLLLLPPSVRVVLLSATMPNALEIAEWLAHLRSQPVHVVQTSARPTPLRHYVCPRGADGLYMVQDETNHFNGSQWQSAVGRLPRPKPRAADTAEGEAAEPKDDGNDRAEKRAAEVVRVLGRFASLDMLPAIVFAFSRRECEVFATHMGRAARACEGASAADDGADSGAADGCALRLRFLTRDEAARVELIYEGAIGVLSDEDAQLAQVTALLPLLRAGVGVHHSGMLPVLRELIEILFSEGLLQVLFGEPHFEPLPSTRALHPSPPSEPSTRALHPSPPPEPLPLSTLFS